MKIYLVGGAIRDRILKLPVKDKDWLVTGATDKHMIKLGYQQVGSDFPVFIHPISGEEYALARTERKIGRGHKDFLVYSHPNITIEDDLMRRDLTINSIAQDELGNYIDPYDGLTDIKLKILRHVSNAFIEDPLRVLRVARFSAYLSHLGFNIAKETMLLMKKMVKRGDLYQLTPSRIWQETKKAMQSLSPYMYFDILNKCGLLYVFFLELKLYNINIRQFNKLIFKIIEKLKQSYYITSDYSIILSSSLYIFITNFSILNKNKNNNLLIAKKICTMLAIPNYIYNLILLALKCNNLIKKSKEKKEVKIIKILGYIDAWRKPYRIKKISKINLIYTFNEKNSEQYNFYFEQNNLLKAFEISKKVDIKKIIKEGYKGIKIKEEINKRRIKYLNKYFNK